MATDQDRAGAPASEAEAGGGNGAAPGATKERRRMVVSTSRPFFYNAEGERVELSLDSLGGRTNEVDAAAVNALGTGPGGDAAAPAAPAAAGEAPLAPDARPIYKDASRQIFLNPDTALRVGARPGGAPPAATPAAGAPASPSSSPSAPEAAAPPPVEPLAAAASPSSPPPPSSVAPPVLEPLASVAEPPAPAKRPEPAAVEAAAIEVAPAPRMELAVPPMPSGDAPVPVEVSYAATAAEVATAPDELGRTDSANVEIRSEELDEILSAMPGGLLRWGISGVFLTICVLGLVSWFIAYPDVVKGRIALTTLTPPVRLVARTGGDVARVFVADGAQVRPGDPLVLMKNPAELADVQALTAALDRLEPALQGSGPIAELSFGRPLALGSLQAPYSALQQAFGDYRLAQDQAFYAQKLIAARQQVADLQSMRSRLEAQQGLVQEQLALSDRARTRTRELVQRGLAAPADVDKAEEDYLQKRYAVENGRTALSNNEVQLGSQRTALLDLEQRRSDDGQRGLVTLRNAYHAMRAAITAWEQENLLRAPVGGTVSYFRELRDNQYVGAAEPMVAVLPASAGLVGRVTLNGMGAGKVKAGQRVIIRFESYPHQEYGTVEGRVVRVSQLGFQPDARAPEVTTFQVEVSMPKGLVTSYGRRLEFRQEMRGDVDVVTQDMRLLQRIFNQIRSGSTKG